MGLARAGRAPAAVDGALQSSATPQTAPALIVWHDAGGLPPWATPARGCPPTPSGQLGAATSGGTPHFCHVPHIFKQARDGYLPQQLEAIPADVAALALAGCGGQGGAREEGDVGGCEAGGGGWGCTKPVHCHASRENAAGGSRRRRQRAAADPRRAGQFARQRVITFVLGDARARGPRPQRGCPRGPCPPRGGGGRGNGLVCAERVRAARAAAGDGDHPGRPGCARARACSHQSDGRN